MGLRLPEIVLGDAGSGDPAVFAAWVCLVVLKAHVYASFSYPLVSLSLTLCLGLPTPVELLPAEPLTTDDPAGRALVTEGIALARHQHGVSCPGPL